MQKKYNAIILLSVVLIILIASFIVIQLNFNILGYVLPSRLKKVAAILLVGAAIGVSSLVFQTLTENNLLTPSVIGLDAVYLFIQTILIFVFGTFSALLANTYVNFFISVILMILFTLGLFKLVFKKSVSVYFILLFGMVMGTCFQSLSNFMHMVMNPDDFLMLQDRMFASFNTVNSRLLGICAVIILIMLFIIYRKSHELDVLSLGKVHAMNLGIDLDKLTRALLLVVAVLVSVSTALVGPITFLGIIVCNVTYQFMKTFEHRLLIPATIAISAITLLVGQMMTQYLFDGNTEITIMINFAGGLYFIYLLFKEGAHD
ncbi:iron chelate uptake ABC transporter family permease subunit [Macrococcus equipercicus]|uniref:Iron chelate uptake ABC transporter family permease subunit n=1 Tax=Macrococcus equipercicus TaxID=69967 RepID=A0ABQ6R8D9_9STAP|nr:iron chelate uptake ABC transporter family permease subunit [Macrococcus equipercicus]KAA1039361.1 iron chelate uptake ABC transporter family permease subunit [Macrococcus equipercicus]